MELTFWAEPLDSKLTSVPSSSAPLQVDLYKECPFWLENTFCMNRDCSVETAEEVSVAFRSCLALVAPDSI